MTYDPGARRAVAELARQLEELKDSIRNGTSRPQLGTSSIEDGAITEYNLDGTLKQTIGKQPDGTNTVAAHNGPPPPEPTVPTIEILSGAVRVSWDGLWVDGAFTPMDFSRIDVHFIDDLSDDPLEMPARASILSQGWGDAALPLIPGTYRAVLVAWTQSGKYTASQPSEEFVVLSVVDGIEITETNIADDSISTPKLQANSVTALKVAAGAILADSIAAGAITADKLSAIMTLSTLFRTAEEGARSEWDTDSLRFYDVLDNLRTRISGDDTFIDGSARLSQLETDSATLGGETLGPPGGRFKVGAAILDAPTLPLEHAAQPVSLLTLYGDPSGPVFTDDDADYYWRWGAVIDGQQKLYRINPTTGAVVDGTLFAAPSPATSAGLKADGMVQVSAGPSPQVIRRARSGFAGATFTSPSTSAVIPAPGTGGYAPGDPVIGAQRGSGHILLAHRVQGAQVIGGLAYSDGEIMVRRYTSSASGIVLTMSLEQRIKTGLITDDPILSVLMDDVDSAFDLTVSPGYAGLVISVDGDVDGSGASHAAVAAYDTGADVGVIPLTGGADRWSGLSKGLLWDGSSFFSTAPGGDTLRQYGAGVVDEPDMWHTYTYWDGVNETQMAPPAQRPVYARLSSKWSIPSLPDGVSQIRLYESLTNTRANFERVGTFAGGSGLPVSVEQDSIQPPAGAATNAPPAVSTFVNGDAYEIGDELGNSWQAGALKLRGLVQPHVAHAANATQTLATGSVTVLTTLDTVVDASTRLDNGVDDDIAYDATTGEFTLRWPGVYLVSANARIAADATATGVRALYLLKNGANMAVRQSGAIGTSSYDAARSKQFRCDAGDKISIAALQNSGGPLSTVVTGTEISITRISN